MLQSALTEGIRGHLAGPRCCLHHLKQVSKEGMATSKRVTSHSTTRAPGHTAFTCWTRSRAQASIRASSAPAAAAADGKPSGPPASEFAVSWAPLLVPLAPLEPASLPEGGGGQQARLQHVAPPEAALQVLHTADAPSLALRHDGEPPTQRLTLLHRVARQYHTAARFKHVWALQG
eukprot:CAMPEP_0202346636 /NCGR_PEP_ID=MMETSP1126-20121109/5339_1 /ASSEMBLY_ACC=CAM_ASM_000457 /TAXON_ID=3047 /ORGANISM="Dunaliella tertiolecta, Strain CCMP1320" /LENGTH=175 /DNA_ID=CAMNT_0048938067 /DNA_START=401 /DNA_END=927 /DNA_ORIENTATION=+